MSTSENIFYQKSISKNNYEDDICFSSIKWSKDIV